MAKNKKKKFNIWKYKGIILTTIITVAIFLFITSSYSILYDFISANNMAILIVSGVIILILIALGLYSKNKIIKKILNPIKC